MISVSVSLGELVDKITILEIKKKMIHDESKLVYVNDEYKRLTAILKKYRKENHIEIPVFLIEKLYSINLELWDIEDKIRVKEREQDFGEEFIKLARSVYLTNDQRFDVKSQISQYGNSEIREQKSYENYDA